VNVLIQAADLQESLRFANFTSATGRPLHLRWDHDIVNIALKINWWNELSWWL